MGQRYVAYYRVSTAKQGESGLGLEAQQTIIHNFLKNKQDATLVHEYTEIETGTRKGNNRPELKQALATAKITNSMLLIAKLDRLARNVHFISGLMESKVDFIALDFPEANRLTLHIMAAFAEHEAECISQRTKAALQAAKARGKKLGNPQNLLEQHRSAGRAAIALQRREKAMHFAFQLNPLISDFLKKGFSLNKIAREFNTRKITTASGLQGSWTATAVKNSLKWCGSDES